MFTYDILLHISEYGIILYLFGTFKKILNLSVNFYICLYEELIHFCDLSLLLGNFWICCCGEWGIAYYIF